MSIQQQEAGGVCDTTQTVLVIIQFVTLVHFVLTQLAATLYFTRNNIIQHTSCPYYNVKLREREGQRVDVGRSLNGHL